MTTGKKQDAMQQTIEDTGHLDVSSLPPIQFAVTVYWASVIVGGVNWTAKRLFMPAADIMKDAEATIRQAFKHTKQKGAAKAVKDFKKGAPPIIDEYKAKWEAVLADSRKAKAKPKQAAKVKVPKKPTRKLNKALKKQPARKRAKKAKADLSDINRQELEAARKRRKRS